MSSALCTSANGYCFSFSLQKAIERGLPSLYYGPRPQEGGLFQLAVLARGWSSFRILRKKYAQSRIWPRIPQVGGRKMHHSWVHIMHLYNHCLKQYPILQMSRVHLLFPFGFCFLSGCPPTIARNSASRSASSSPSQAIMLTGDKSISKPILYRKQETNTESVVDLFFINISSCFTSSSDAGHNLHWWLYKWDHYLIKKLSA